MNNYFRTTSSETSLNLKLIWPSVPPGVGRCLIRSMAHKGHRAYGRSYYYHAGTTELAGHVHLSIVFTRCIITNYTHTHRHTNIHACAMLFNWDREDLTLRTILYKYNWDTSHVWIICFCKCTGRFFNSNISFIDHSYMYYRLILRHYTVIIC